MGPLRSRSSTNTLHCDCVLCVVLCGYFVARMCAPPTSLDLDDLRTQIVNRNEGFAGQRRLGHLLGRATVTLQPWGRSRQPARPHLVSERWAGRWLVLTHATLHTPRRRAASPPGAEPAAAQQPTPNSVDLQAKGRRPDLDHVPRPQLHERLPDEA